MKAEKIDLQDTHAFNSFFLDYVAGRENLRPFYGHPPSLNSFAAQIGDKKSFSPEHRLLLQKALEAHYAQLKLPQPVAANLALLPQPNTFTVTTGHQLNVFTGPLYFVFKIVTVINACRQLAAAYPGFHFVPVYWMASEDHDYEEIKSFRLYGKKHTWETQQSGAVGRFDTTGLADLANALPGDNRIFAEAYSKNKRLSDAVRSYVNALFGEYGLLVVDGDDAQLKKVFVPAIEQDVLHQAFHKRVEAQTQKLQSLGYHTQVNAREINFFYLRNNLRSRIERTGTGFKVIDTSLSFSAAEMNKLIQTEPEVFSPNVVLRPLYQEMILPNLAYVGGPAEMVYWLQLKPVFDDMKVPFPILLPRNFGLIIDPVIERKMKKTGLTHNEVFLDTATLTNSFTRKLSDHSLSLEEEQVRLREQFDSIRLKTSRIDSSLDRLVDAEHHRAEKSLAKIEKKMLKAEKRKHADTLRQLEEIKSTLFPNGGLQERTDNVLNFLHTRPQLLRELVDTLNAFDIRMHVMWYD